ncbi:MAG: hypothetical protein KDD14_00785 [Saprospiraceae bacterium]|nr:hypothetical protein [Saprospiraceae bacterium]
MKLKFSFFYPKSCLPFFLLAVATSAFGQTQLPLVSDADSTKPMNMDATYTRPFLQLGKMPVALGGYVEANTAWTSEDGVSEGLSFQVPRVTLFASSAIGRYIKFLTEIEFEEGGREINVEYASMDVQFLPALNLRGGIILNPIGAFNQNHDGPKWEFVNRPVASTQMLPATWSNAGFGVHGKFYQGPWTFGYETYLTNGFDESIIDNPEGRTALPEAKENGERFEESFNGRPLLTAKTAIRHRQIGELGLSYMGGTFNKFEDDGLTVDKKRQVHVFAVDFNTQLAATATTILGEWAWVLVDVPDTYDPQYGNKQYGGHLDIVQQVFSGPILRWQKAAFNLAARLDYVDWNVGNFDNTGDSIGDSLFGISGGVGFRPTAQTVIRLNYVYQWKHDLFGNPPAHLAGWYFGLSSYF